VLKWRGADGRTIGRARHDRSSVNRISLDRGWTDSERRDHAHQCGNANERPDGRGNHFRAERSRHPGGAH
jgi:hypothetical protein